MEEKVLKKKYSVKSERVKTVPYRSVIIRNHKSIRDKKNIKKTKNQNKKKKNESCSWVDVIIRRIKMTVYGVG